MSVDVGVSTQCIVSFAVSVDVGISTQCIVSLAGSVDIGVGDIVLRMIFEKFFELKQG